MIELMFGLPVVRKVLRLFGECANNDIAGFDDDDDEF
jgi:hypothetical protein